MKAKQLMQVDFYRGAIHDKPGTIICVVRIRGEANSLIIILYLSLSNFQFMSPNNNGNWIKSDLISAPIESISQLFVCSKHSVLSWALGT